MGDEPKVPEFAGFLSAVYRKAVFLGSRRFSTTRRRSPQDVHRRPTVLSCGTGQCGCRV